MKTNNNYTGIDWRRGTFFLDCSGKVEEYLKNNRVSISYYENDGCYYTVSNDYKEIVELPLKTSDKYPFNTGLVPEGKKESLYLDNYRDIYPRIDIDYQVEIINKTRSNMDKDELMERKIKHDNYIPRFLTCKSYKSDDNYQWHMVPFTIPEESSDGKFKDILVPVGIDHYNHSITYGDLWEIKELPKKNSKSSFGLHTPKRFLHTKISPFIAAKWYINNIEQLKKYIDKINFINSNNLDWDAYNTFLFSKEYIDYALEANMDLNDVLNTLRSQIEVCEGARTIIQEYLIEKFGDRIREKYPELSDEELKKLVKIPYIKSEILSRHIDNISTYGDDWTIFKTDYSEPPFIYYSSKDNYYELTGTDFYDSNEFRDFKSPINIPKGYFEKGMEFLAAVLQHISNNLGFKEIRKKSNIIMTWEQAVFLNTRYIDILKSIADHKPISIKFAFIDIDVYDNKKGESPLAKFGEIHINSIDDLDNIDLSNIERYYSYEEYPLERFKLTTDFESPDEIERKKNEIKKLRKQ